MGDVAGLIAILAGGAGERLGGSKPLSPLAGRPLICHQLAAAHDSGLDVIVVSKRSVALPELDCEIVYEPERPRHPLCGLSTALARAEQLRGPRGSDTPVVTVACDMPFLTGRLLAWFATGSAPRRAMLARVDGRLQPLLGRYLPAHRPALARALRDGRTLQEAVLRLEPVVVEERELERFGDPRRLCFNVNSPADVRLAEAWLEGAPDSSTGPAAARGERTRPPAGGLPGGRSDPGGAAEQLSQRSR
jgi:molybdopterin-guanine dinucleotide biosynthesis protein A